MLPRAVVLYCGVLVLVMVCVVYGRPSEEERVRLWRQNNKWPPVWQPETDAMKLAMAAREKDIQSLTGADERWENWIQYTQSRLVPKFTPFGFKLIDMPKDVFARLLEAVRVPLQNVSTIRTEGDVDVIYNNYGLHPKFIDIGSLAWQTINDLRPLHEEWWGLGELVPTSAYGVRVYLNTSSLVMHYDRVETHVISSIVHIAHDPDSEPWPLDIEDHDGRLHSVVLKPGQMLFYESSKCLHGRMKTFRGQYYASIFLHYKPKDRNIWNYNIEDVIAAVPPQWRRGIKGEHGSRFSGACMTIDSRVAEGAPPRVASSNSPFERFQDEL